MKVDEIGRTYNMVGLRNAYTILVRKREEKRLFGTHNVMHSTVLICGPLWAFVYKVMNFGLQRREISLPVEMVNHHHNGTDFFIAQKLFSFKQMCDNLIKYSVYIILYVNGIMVTCLQQNNNCSFTVF
jgi:hypothetical protein